MMRVGTKSCSTLALCSLLFAPRAAHAAEHFAEKGSFALSAERLTGVVFSSDKTENAGTTSTNKYTSINFLTNPYSALASNYSMPRLAFDYFPINGLSLGGSVAVFHVAGSTKTEAAGVSQDRDRGDLTGFLFAPRVGYAFMFTPTVGIWPRGGVTYWTTTTSNGDANNNEAGMNRLALTIEAPFVFALVPHVAIYVGPTLDLGLSGSNSTTVNSVKTSVDHTAHDIGVQAGLGVFF